MTLETKKIDQEELKRRFAGVLDLKSNHDLSIQRRLFEIMDLCSGTPRTYAELADYFGVHYQTIYSNVQLLQSLGIIVPEGRRRGRQILWSTNWAAMSQIDGEIAWLSSTGKYFPVSEWISRFGGEGSEWAANHMKNVYRALVAIHLNKSLRASEAEEYGPRFDAACRQLVAEADFFFEGIRFVLEQAMDSRIWESEDAHRVFSLPEGFPVETANEIHDQLELYFQSNDYYEDEEVS